MKTIVLAGGKGTRLLPLTTVLPKPLLPVGDYPILEIVIRQLKKQGFTKITLAVGYLSHLFEAYFGDGSKWGVELEYSVERESLGTAGPILLVKDLSSTFLVMNGDLLTTLDFNRVVEYHKKKDAVLTIALQERSHQINLGYVERDGKYNITGYIEKPVHRYEVGMGIYVFEPEALSYIKKGEKADFPELVLRLIGDGKKVVGYPCSDFWLDIGRHEEYEKAQNEFEKLKHLFF
ncbi:MAG: sugar phosphate nucleotidyltransferase [Candidatus Eisenbacteria bacterium]|nr:sugar phosphate nucleotidyltransferase [Candidatus Eisenbacteria bacterium]